jgi:hypothetical protein
MAIVIRLILLNAENEFLQNIAELQLFEDDVLPRRVIPRHMPMGYVFWALMMASAVFHIGIPAQLLWRHVTGAAP